MKKIVLQIMFIAVLALSSCIGIPREHHTLSQRGAIISIEDANDCDINQFENMPESDPGKKPELDSKGFKIMTWNMLKGMKEGWNEDFKHLIEYKDILTLQEARLNNDLRNLLKKGYQNWDISTAFKFYGAEVGVLTASALEPDFTCTFRIKEPLTSIPKTTMITVYPLSNSDQSLMVVNIHAINFTLGTESFYRQLQKVEKILLQHDGPMIFSGDVNTWSEKRMALLKDLAIRLGLKAVTFNNPNRTKIFGHDIDHIYYRELTVREATVIKVNSSDHNPLLVTFKLEETG